MTTVLTEKIIFFVAASTLRAVSYTHLDVYKRQVFTIKKVFLTSVKNDDFII